MAEFKLELNETQKLLAIQIAAGIGCIVIGWLFVIQPALSKAWNLKRLDAEHERRHGLIAEIHQVRSDKRKLDQDLLVQGQERTILNEVSSLANKSGVDVQSLSPARTGGEHYDKVTLSLKIQSSFRSLLKFLNEIEASSSNLSVTELSIRTGFFTYRSSGEKKTFSVELKLGTYLKKI